ncbi:MAG: hypothetical protein HY752_07555 [Nitrospirae bacterium]|nr:hypothetical protein [Nitrospirota bacterium]
MKGTSFIEMNKMEMEEIRAIHEEFRFYRQSGLALSATLLVLCGTLFKLYFDKLTFPISYTCINISLFLSLSISIISAVSIQICHFMGYKNMARRHFPPAGFDQTKWANDRWTTSNRWFKVGEISVWVSAISLLIGFFTSVYLWSIS